jgi:glyoxylase-like metal-dependent hydrolase (beta-lactamase superfamily II)
MVIEFRALIDTGRTATVKDLKPRLRALPATKLESELLIVTHVGRDHIESVLKLLEDERLPV